MLEPMQQSYRAVTDQAALSDTTQALERPVLSTLECHPSFTARNLLHDTCVPDGPVYITQALSGTRQTEICQSPQEIQM